MEKDAPHPWSSKRWFTEIIFREVLKKFPVADEDSVFSMAAEVGIKKWKKMNEAEKLRFLQCEEIDKEKVGKEAKVKKRTTKKKRDPNMPKHAMTAFFCFMNTNRDRVKAANPDFTTPDIAKVRVHIQYSGVYILKFVKYFKILWEMGCVHEMASCMGEEITILN